MCGKCVICKICIRCPIDTICSKCCSMFCRNCYYKGIETDGGQNVDIVYFLCPVCKEKSH